jgi:hypothetical protein
VPNDRSDHRTVEPDTGLRDEPSAEAVEVNAGLTAPLDSPMDPNLLTIAAEPLGKRYGGDTLRRVEAL